MSLKPPKYVDTVRRLIYWQYAQLIAKAAGFEGNYGFDFPLKEARIG
jgi:hypothetical protein